MYQHHKVILQLDHNTSPESSSTTTTTKPPTTQLRNHSYTIDFHQYSLHYHCRHHHRHYYHYPHRQYLLHQHYRYHYHQRQYTNRHPNTRPYSAQHPHPIQDPHTLYLYYHTPVVLHRTLPHLSPHPAGSPAVGTLGGSPTIRTTTKGGHHHLAFLKAPAPKERTKMQTPHTQQYLF